MSFSLFVPEYLYEKILEKLRIFKLIMSMSRNLTCKNFKSDHNREKMKKLLHMFLVMITLVVPVLAHAVPCNMSMPQAKMASLSMQDKAMNEDPCPNHKQPASVPCDGVMSIADCLDTDTMAMSDTVNFKFAKADTMPVGVLPSQPWEEIALMTQAPRAPPSLQAIDIPKPSIIITTQRFRV